MILPSLSPGLGIKNPGLVYEARMLDIVSWFYDDIVHECMNFISSDLLLCLYLLSDLVIPLSFLYFQRLQCIAPDRLHWTEYH